MSIGANQCLSSTEFRELAAFAETVALSAGQRICDTFASGQVQLHEKKAGNELVTSADLASNELIRQAVARHTPAAQYFSEEGARQAVDWNGPVWVVDPLDGTVNFTRGHSHFSVALAYVVDRAVQVAVVHSPLQHETFVAVRDDGAALNGVALQKRKFVPLSGALVSTGFPHDRADLNRILERLGRVVRRCRDIRRLASPSLDICWVAAGRLDAAYETLRPWDVAAAGLIAREAGVERAHYGNTDSDVPAEVCGQDVAFAPPGTLQQLMEAFDTVS